MEDIKGRTFLIIDTFECGPITATSDERGQTRINARRSDVLFDKSMENTVKTPSVVGVNWYQTCLFTVKFKSFTQDGDVDGLGRFG
jgi:hypothetical protein